MLTLTPDEKAIVRRLAEGDRTAKDEAEAIYMKHVKQYVNEGKKSFEIAFLSEAFNVCPDLVLRAKYRKLVLEAK